MLTAPNPNAQGRVVDRGLRQGAGRSGRPWATSNVTAPEPALGDPIEIQALKRAFGDLYKKNGKPPPSAPHCGLSSVKTNIGHLEPAAGMAEPAQSAVGRCEHREIPALLHFEELNPYIDLKGSPFYIVDRTCSLGSAQGGREYHCRAGRRAARSAGAEPTRMWCSRNIPRQNVKALHGRRWQIQLIVLSAKNEASPAAYACESGACSHSQS